MPDEQTTPDPPTDAHRVEITFDDGVYAKLICPESGCTPARACSECGRTVGDSDVKPCYDCPNPDDECWVKSWFDNVTATELLAGTMTVPIAAEWHYDSMIARIIPAAASPDERLREALREIVADFPPTPDRDMDEEEIEQWYADHGDWFQRLTALAAADREAPDEETR